MDIPSWQAAQDEINALSPALDFPTVLSDKDFQPHLSALGGCSHDSGRESVIAALVNSDAGLVVTADQVGAIMGTYSYDSGREEALEKLGPRIADPLGLLRHTHTMSYDSGRDVLHKWSARQGTPVRMNTAIQKQRFSKPSFALGVGAGLILAAIGQLLFAVLRGLVA